MRNIARISRGVIIAAGFACAATACDRYASARQHAQSGSYTATDSMGVTPREISTVALHAAPELVENSAAAMSVRQSGVLFTINDSGNDPLLFAVDTMGANRGVWRLNGATNVDWESAAVAPCASTAPAGPSCVYVGDTGDNNSRHPFRVIYRVREPSASGGRGTLEAERLRYRYSDGPHDVESMYVASTGDILLVTKRPLGGGGGRLRPALVFSLPQSAWRERGFAIAQLVDSLPIVPGSAPLRLVTDAALSPDGRHLAVRTYAQVYIFAAGPTGLVDHRVNPAVCNIVPLGEPQGEGVTWANNGGRLVFTSEGANVPLHIATCPLPGKTK
jgi:hypothetical protein